MAKPKKGLFNPISRQIADDFALFWKSLDGSPIHSVAKQREMLAAAHRYASAFVTLSRASGDPDGNGGIFLREMASDGVRLIRALASGDARSGRFYLRSVIENIWRHFYFRDHPVEFGWVVTRAGYYLEMRALRDHCSWLPQFVGAAKPTFDALCSLNGELSTYVHSTSPASLALSSTLRDIQIDLDDCVIVTRQVHDVMKRALLIVIVGEATTFESLHFQTQSFLLGCLTAEQRRVRQLSLDECAP